MKPFYVSKMTWLGIITTLISVLDLVQKFVSEGKIVDPAGVIGLVIGVLMIILRVWFTDTPIETPKAQAKLNAAEPK